MESGMTLNEFFVLVKGMKAVYTDPKFLPDKDAAKVWYGLLKDLPYSVASAAVKKYMMQEKYPPTIADIRRIAADIADPDRHGMPELEAWSMVRRAIRNGSYSAEDEYSKLPGAVQKAVGSAGQLRAWALDEDFNDAVASSNFMRSYRAVIGRERLETQVSREVRELIRGTSAALADTGKDGVKALWD